MGAYYFAFAPYIPTGAALKVLPGVYDVKVLSYGVKGVFTNTVPVDAYRGAGRPESIYCIERLMDYAADELGVDPVELRRKNFIRPEQMPFKTAAGELYDTGEFAKVMDTCLQKADWSGIAARKAQARGQGPAARHRHVLLHRIDHGRSRPSTPRSSSPTTASSTCWSAPRPTARATTPPTPRSCTSG